MTGLPDDWLQRYLRDGFALPLPVVAPAEVAAVRREVDAALTRPGRAPEPADEDTEGRLGALTGGGGHVPFVESRHLDVPVIHALCTSGVVLDACRAILGGDLLLWRSTVIRKPPGGDGFRWHQDFGGVFGPGEPYGLVPPLHLNVWLALDPTTRENGCLRFVPGEHHVLPSEPSGPGRRATLLVRPECVDESRAVDAPLAAGEAVVFGDRALHASWPNATDRPRVGLAMRFTLPQVRVRGHFPGHTSLLVSGRDALGVNPLSDPPPPVGPAPA